MARIPQMKMAWHFVIPIKLPDQRKGGETWVSELQPTLLPSFLPCAQFFCTQGTQRNTGERLEIHCKSTKR